MAFTTLMTFMLQVPLSVYSVEIMGSWDNFSKSYQLQRDRRTGPGHWRGCHKFENITCDGETLDASQSRDGGLKMGGTYWYYYVLNGTIEYHDPAEPYTAVCPLLPGQVVNVLDVPVQARDFAGGSHNGSTTSVDSLLVFTLDPKDKYLPPGVRRAATTSAIQQRKAELAAKTFKPKLQSASTDPPSGIGGMKTGQSTLERQHSLLSVFHKMRQTRSAGANVGSGLAWPRSLFSRSGSRAGQTAKRGDDDIPEVPKIPGYLPSRAATATRDACEPPIVQPGTPPPPMPSRAPPLPTSCSVQPTSLPVSRDALLHDHVQVALVSVNFRDNDLNPKVSAFDIPGASSSSSSNQFTALEQLKERNSFFSEIAPSAGSKQIIKERVYGPETGIDILEERLNASNIPLQQPSSATNAAALSEATTTTSPNSSEFFCPASHCYADSSTSSYTIGDDLSPYLDSNTTHSHPISPLHLSQPETPVMSDFGDDISIRRNSSSIVQLTLSDKHDPDHVPLEAPTRAPPPPPPPSKPTTAYPALGGFHSYTLSNSENASILTIRNLPSTTFKAATTTTNTTTAPSPFTQHDSRQQNLVHSWNDGMRPLSKFDLDDLSYLANVIS